MLEKNIERLIFFGTALRFLQDADPTYSIKGNSDGWATLENLSSFLDHLNELGLIVTSRAHSIRRLREIKSELEKSSGERLSADQANG